MHKVAAPILPGLSKSMTRIPVENSQYVCSLIALDHVIGCLDNDVHHPGHKVS